jgi:hypothetical protein
MSINSVDDLVSEISSEKFHRADWQYRTLVAAVGTTSLVAGLDLSTQLGQYGQSNAFPGTALNWVSCNDAAGNGTQVFGIPHGGNVSPDTKHLISASATVPPAGLAAIGGLMVLVDLQGYWPGISHATTSPQTLVGTPSLRYTDGLGCRLYMVATTGLTATAHNISVNYINQDENTVNTGTVTARVSSPVGQLSSAGAAGLSPLFFPLVNGDTGVQNAANVTMSAVASGVSALCLAKPLCTIPFTTSISWVTEREFVNQTPSMPAIPDGACLVWLYFSTASSAPIAVNTGFYGDIQVAWG